MKETMPVFAKLFFVFVFQGLAVWAACVVLASVLPSYFGLRKFFYGIARPAQSVVAILTPAAVPGWAIAFLTVFWLLSLRVMFYLAMASFGLLPAGGA
jgi:hypothetical protein